MKGDRAECIARQNDTFRRGLGMIGGIPGRAFLTRSIAALPAEDRAAIIEGVRAFDTFDPGNNPWGERDYGRLAAAGHTVLWKIDYYAGPGMDAGAEDPRASYRTLTIMLAEDY
jgi:hypothetical protein